MRGTGYSFYIALFYAILLIPAGMWICGVKEPYPFFDNRRPAALPEFDITNLDPYPAKLDSFINDNFPVRNTAIHWLNINNARYFSVSPKPEVITVGSDKWLFDGADNADFVLGMKPIADSLITMMIEELNSRQQYCKSVGAEFRLVLVPNKLTMYPEHWPINFRLAEKYATAVELLLSRSAKECTVPILYLRDSLEQQKSAHQLFYTTDTHWNYRGTYFGYRSIVRWLRNDLSLPITPFTDISATIDTIHGGVLSNILGIADEWQDTIYDCKLPPNALVKQINQSKYACDSTCFSYCWEYQHTFINADTSLPRILIMRDSFTNPLMRELLSPNFSRSTFIWDYWQHKLNKEIIASEKPDIVLCIMNEQFLMNLVKYQHRDETGGTGFMQPRWIKWW